MTKTCAILGASGHGKVVAEIAELNGYQDIVFLMTAGQNYKTSNIGPCKVIQNHC